MEYKKVHIYLNDMISCGSWQAWFKGLGSGFSHYEM